MAKNLTKTEARNRLVEIEQIIATYRLADSRPFLVFEVREALQTSLDREAFNEQFSRISRAAEIAADEDRDAVSELRQIQADERAAAPVVTARNIRISAEQIALLARSASNLANASRCLAPNLSDEDREELAALSRMLEATAACEGPSASNDVHDFNAQPPLNSRKLIMKFSFKTLESQVSFTSIVAKALRDSRAHKATGNRDGEQSVSYLKTILREKGFTIPGQADDFEDTLKSLGFHIREVHAGVRGARRAFAFDPANPVCVTAPTATHVAPTGSHVTVAPEATAPARLDPASFADVSTAIARSLRYFSAHVIFASIADARTLDLHADRMRAALATGNRSSFFEAVANFSATNSETFDEFMADVLETLGVKKTADLLPLVPAPQEPKRAVLLTRKQFALLGRAAAALRFSTHFDADEERELALLAEHFELTAAQLA